MKYKVNISPKMRAVNQEMLDSCVGINHCISTLGDNLVVEVPKKDCECVVAALKQGFRDVALIKNAYLMLPDLHDFILVKPLITESPVRMCEGVMVPDLEKTLVDRCSDREYAGIKDSKLQGELQDSFERYPVNVSKLIRYAGRKGKAEEMKEKIGLLDKDRVKLVKSIQQYLISTPVEKAWLFGSFSRREERPDSDVDILVSFGENGKMGLLAFSNMSLDLERLTGRTIDLVVDKSLKPFAMENVNQDKVLIYERAV